VLDVREQAGGESWTIMERNAHEVHDRALTGTLHQLEDLLNGGSSLAIAEHHGVVERVVITLGINEAELVPTFRKSLQDADGNRGLAAPRWPSHQHRRPVGLDPHLRAVLPFP